MVYQGQEVQIKEELWRNQNSLVDIQVTPGVFEEVLQSLI
jgi:hypothetical protein